MRKYSLTLILCLLPLLTFAQEGQRPADEQLLREWIRTMASDEFGGRKPMTPYEDKTVEYLRGQMEQMGLQPAFDGSWYQPFGMVSVTAKPRKNQVPLKGRKRVRLHYPEDLVIWTARATDKVELPSAEFVFCGFGIHAPEIGRASCRERVL